ncbi:MAG: glycolate oxidase subunit GlcE [Pseudomonadota bacterium]
MLLEQWGERIRNAAQKRQPLRFRGAGSKDFYGHALIGEILDTRAYRGIVAYEPSELFITARCGTTLAELEKTLAEHGQMLAFEPPYFGADATLGGCVASGLSGPRRVQVGALRDFVLGVKMLDAQGTSLSFGGQVIKNVAGYDVPRLLTGSLGTLGLLLEISLKVLPLPAAEETLCFALSQEAALKLINSWRSQALPVSASAWADELLSVRLSGASSVLDSFRKKLGGERLAPSAALAFWTALREQTHSFFAQDDARPLWRIALPANTPALALADVQAFFEWGGMQRWLRGGAASTIRALAEQAGGHATLFRADSACKTESGTFQPLSAPLLNLHRRLKLAFDEQGIFNPERLYPGL